MAREFNRLSSLERNQVPTDVARSMQIYQSQNKIYLQQIYAHIQSEKARFENSKDENSPHRLPPPIPPPLHILSWIKGYSENSKNSFKESLRKYVKMSTDCSPNSEHMHKCEVETHLAQMHEDYKINAQEEFKSFVKPPIQEIPKRRGQEEKIIKEIND